MNPDQRKIVNTVPESGLSVLRNRDSDSESEDFRPAKRRLESQNLNEITVTVAGARSLSGSIPTTSGKVNTSQGNNRNGNPSTPFEFCGVQASPAAVNVYHGNNTVVKEEFLHEESPDGMDDFCDVSSMVRVEITESQDTQVVLKDVPRNVAAVPKPDSPVAPLTVSKQTNPPVALKEVFSPPLPNIPKPVTAAVVAAAVAAGAEVGIRVSRVPPPRVQRTPATSKTEPDPEEALQLLDDVDIESEGETEDHVEVEDYDSDDLYDHNYPDNHCTVEDIEEAIEENIRKVEMEEKLKNPKLPAAKRTKSIADVVCSLLPLEPLAPEFPSSYVLNLNENVIFGKDGTMWSSVPKDAPHVSDVRPGPVGDAKLRTEPIGCFRLFFSEFITKTIQKNTNEKMKESCEKYAKHEGSIQETSLQELEALFGLLYLSAALRSNHLSAELLFNTEYSGTRFIATMSRRRFEFLINSLRFDERDTREERTAKSKLAPINDIWGIFVGNCMKNYVPSGYVTVDQQLVNFNGKCPFRARVPSRPRTCGLKILTMCDSASKYVVNAIPHCGIDTVPPDVPVAEYYVKELVRTIKGSQRNVTMNKCFTSIPLIRDLLNDDLSVVGAVREDAEVLPPCFTDIDLQDRKEHSSLFIFSGEVTAVSYKPAQNKLTCLLSSVHHNPNDGVGRLPQAVATYSRTRGAVSALDEMCKSLSTSRKSRRWSMCLFFYMLDIAAANSYVMYLHNFFRSERTKNQKPLSRISFLLKLSEQLTSAWQKHRLEKLPGMSKELKLQLRQVLGISDPAPAGNCRGEQHGKRTYCAHCHYSKHRMTSVYCATCGRPICGEHQKRVCVDC